MPQQQAVAAAAFGFLALVAWLAMSLSAPPEYDCRSLRAAYNECMAVAENDQPGDCAPEHSAAFDCEVMAEGGAAEPVL
jgi:hypothetical protein